MAGSTFTGPLSIRKSDGTEVAFVDADGNIDAPVTTSDLTTTGNTTLGDAVTDTTVFSGSAKSTAPLAGIGYGTGAGGAVTQITSISTGVTLSKVTGQITTVAATTAAGAEDTFTVTNTAVAATDVVVMTTTYAGAGTPIVYCKKVAAGSFDITISNLHATAALDALLVINFVVLKGVAA